MLHKNAVPADMHIVHSWAVADAAALAALSGLVLADEGKVAWQQDVEKFYVLTDYTIPTWTLLNIDGFANPMSDVGDIIYGAAAGAATRLPGNTTVVPLVLTQVGDGTDAQPPEWLPVSAAGNLEFIFSGTASDIATYYQAQTMSTYTAGALQTVGAVASTTPTLLLSLATLPGYPNITRIPVGILQVHYQTQKVAGSNNYHTYAEIYKRAAGGAETLLLTTDDSSSSALNTVQSVTVEALISSPITLLTTDRLVVKIYGVMTASTATVNVLFDDSTSARFAAPSVAVDATNFVPYTGATADVNLGSKDLTATDITGTEIIGAGMSLTERAKGLPQDSKSADYTLVLGDAGKHLLHPSADTTARTFTIPANASVAFPVGTVVSFVNQNAAGIISIAITTDTMRLAGAGSTGTRSLAANGVATAIKITTTEWIISGVGLT